VTAKKAGWVIGITKRPLVNRGDALRNAAHAVEPTTDLR
jgi:hypothetical protein